MFTIQYTAVNGEAATQEFDGRYDNLIRHLIEFPHVVLAVYERATPITKRVRTDMLRSPGILRASRSAKDFMNHH